MPPTTAPRSRLDGVGDNADGEAGSEAGLIGEGVGGVGADDRHAHVENRGADGVDHHGERVVLVAAAVGNQGLHVSGDVVAAHGLGDAPEHATADDKRNHVGNASKNGVPCLTAGALLLGVLALNLSH